MGTRSSPRHLRSATTLFQAALLGALLAACAGSGRGTEPSPREPGQSPAATASAPTFPLTLTDDAGRSVTLPAEPQRIVSLAPSNTEIVCALAACDRLVGVTDFDDYPAQVADVPHVVIAAAVDVEKVQAAEPDLVLAAGNEFTPTPVIEQLIGLGLPVMTLHADTLEEVYADIRLVGQTLAAEGAAEELVEEMQADAQAVVDAVAGAEAPRTFYEVAYFEGAIYTAGAGSFLAELIETAGGEPITGHPQSFAIDVEELLAADPELILLGDASYEPSITPESVAARPGWGEMTAIREDRVIPVTHDVVITRPGPRIVQGLEELARLIHPDRFE